MFQFSEATARGILNRIACKQIEFTVIEQVPHPVSLLKAITVSTVEPEIKISKPDILLLPPGPMPVFLLSATVGEHIHFVQSEPTLPPHSFIHPSIFEKKSTKTKKIPEKVIYG